jgi:hypothetical protein
MTIIYAVLTFQIEDVSDVRYVLISDTYTCCYIQSLRVLMKDALLLVLQKLGVDGTMEWSENQGTCEIHYR